MVSPVKLVEDKTKPIIKLSYPSRVTKKDPKEKEFDKLVQLFKKLEINIPFFEALDKMPLYQKFMKEALSKKRSTIEGLIPRDE